MEIEFKVIKSDNNEYNYQVLIDNKAVYENLESKGDSFDILEGSDKDISVDNALLVFDLPIEELPIGFRYEGEFTKRLNCLEPYIFISKDKSTIDRSYTIMYNLDLTIGNLEEFQNNIAGFAISYGFYPDIEIDNNNLTIELKNANEGEEFKSISSCIDTDILNITEIDRYITSEFVEKNADDLFINKFNFPPEYKYICSQYLIWFGELLTNLNIEADVWTEPDNGGTNLIVSHEKDPELLERIKEIFYQYIQLPNVEFMPSNKSLAQEQIYLVKSLESQVSTFNTQIQLKDASIVMLGAAISTQRNEIVKLNEEKQVLIDSLENGQNKVSKYSFLNGKLQVEQVQFLNKNKSISLDLSLFFGEPKKKK
jgi:hypothetical protein